MYESPGAAFEEEADSLPVFRMEVVSDLLADQFVLADTGGYKFVKIFDPTGGRNSSAFCSHQYEPEYSFDRWALVLDHTVSVQHSE